jgi:hypothetical protein
MLLSVSLIANVAASNNDAGPATLLIAIKAYSLMDHYAYAGPLTLLFMMM